MSNQWLKEQTRYVCIGVTLLCVMAERTKYIHVHHWFSFEDLSEPDISEMIHRQNNQSPAPLGFQTFTYPIPTPTFI